MAKTKRLLALLLTVVMLAGMSAFTVTVSAEETTEESTDTTVTYDVVLMAVVDGVTSDLATITKTEGESVTLADTTPHIYKAGYIFDGWYTDEACTAAATIPVTAAATLYAKFRTPVMGAMYDIYTAGTPSRSVEIGWSDGDKTGANYYTEYLYNFWDYYTGAISIPYAAARGGKNAQWVMQAPYSTDTGWFQMAVGGDDGVMNKDDGAISIGWDMYGYNITNGTFEMFAVTNKDIDVKTTKVTADADMYYLNGISGTNLRLGHNTLNNAWYSLGSHSFNNKWVHYDMVLDMYNKKVVLYADTEKIMEGAMGIEEFYGIGLKFRQLTATGPADFDPESSSNIYIRNFSLYEQSKYDLKNMYDVYTNSDYVYKELVLNTQNRDPAALFYDFSSGARNINYISRDGKVGYYEWAGAVPGTGQVKLDGVKGAAVFSWEQYAQNLAGGATLELMINNSTAVDWSTTAAGGDGTVYLACADGTNLHIGHNSFTDTKPLYQSGSTPLNTNFTWAKFDLVVDVANQTVVLYRDGKIALSGDLPAGIDAVYGFAFKLGQWDGTKGAPKPATMDYAAALTSGNPELVVRSYKVTVVPADELVPGFYVSDLAVSKDGTALEDLTTVAAGDTLTASASLTNTTLEAVSCIMAFALYNGDELADVKVVPVTVADFDGAEAPTASLTVTDATDLGVRVFVWDALSVANPYVTDLEL